MLVNRDDPLLAGEFRRSKYAGSGEEVAVLKESTLALRKIYRLGTSCGSAGVQIRYDTNSLAAVRFFINDNEVNSGERVQLTLHLT